MDVWIGMKLARDKIVNFSGIRGEYKSQPRDVRVYRVRGRRYMRHARSPWGGLLTNRTIKGEGKLIFVGESQDKRRTAVMLYRC